MTHADLLTLAIREPWLLTDEDYAELGEDLNIVRDSLDDGIRRLRQQQLELGGIPRKPVISKERWSRILAGERTGRGERLTIEEIREIDADPGKQDEMTNAQLVCASWGQR